jgi:hypothetical protein
MALVFSSLQNKKNNSVNKLKWINLAFAIATILVVLGFSSRLMEYSDGFTFKFIGMVLGLTAFNFSIYNQKTKNNSVNK